MQVEEKEECPVGDHSPVDQPDQQWDQDARNPFNWPRWKKWMVLLISCVVTFFAGMNSTSITTAGEAISNEFNVDNGMFEYNFFAVTAWNGAAAIVPLATLPIMETYGMRTGYLVSIHPDPPWTGNNESNGSGRLFALLDLLNPAGSGSEFRNAGCLSSYRWSGRGYLTERGGWSGG